MPDAAVRRGMLLNAHARYTITHPWSPYRRHAMCDASHCAVDYAVMIMAPDPLLLAGWLQDEETTVLPQLAAVLDVVTQLRLGILFEAAKVGRQIKS